MSTLPAGPSDTKRVAAQVHRLCLKIADQVDKGQWWNAMANATSLVAACQDGCRAEIASVVKSRAARDQAMAKTTAKKSKGKKKKNGKKKNA